MKAHPEITWWFLGLWIAVVIVGLWITLPQLLKHLPNTHNPAVAAEMKNRAASGESEGPYGNSWFTVYQQLW
jgi:hypothetical protein